MTTFEEDTRCRQCQLRTISDPDLPGLLLTFAARRRLPGRFAELIIKGSRNGDSYDPQLATGVQLGGPKTNLNLSLFKLNEDRTSQEVDRRFALFRKLSSEFTPSVVILLVPVPRRFKFLSLSVTQRRPMKRFFRGAFSCCLPASQPTTPGDTTSPLPSGPPREPPSQPQQHPEVVGPSQPVDLLKGALGITYDVAKIVASNFPLPGLQSVIGLVDYVKALREVRYSILHGFYASAQTHSVLRTRKQMMRL